ncbi:hypothetical protein LX16_1541 [Stackebrandtia albiflava]|uniref:Enoyl reductase (ER) domain-containing protein n=1 Tax=Stackebrandtia albiflava TaxID=406432 RepID=A0A562VDC6_9ACTN|nr:NADP-dependent oxidoreductase [Stackebrandtia albiflava]TWJ15827.1 hypothetical protein LX16_1541 [Stackebrandtia albiflava]
MTANREIHLKSRPDGEPTLADFSLVESAMPEPADGQILVRNTWMSVDPYMRRRMDEGDDYMPAFVLGAALDGAAVGEVVASRAGSVPEGTVVTHGLGWREHAVLDVSAATVIDTDLAAQEDYLGALGTTGLTAYATLTEVAPVKEDDVVFVSAAAGAVGSVAGQLARVLGASKVIGSAGGPVKTAALTADFGFDAALDYRAGSLAEQLRTAAPDGIDVYVDNVGGDHLTAAIDALRPWGRIGMVGAISGYNATEPVPGPTNLFSLAAKNATLRGMLVPSYFHLFDEWIEKAASMLAEGTLRTSRTVVEGLDNAPAAFLGMMRGENVGKMLVRL